MILLVLIFIEGAVIFYLFRSLHIERNKINESDDKIIDTVKDSAKEVVASIKEFINLKIK
jgi:hypothetical protein